MKKHTYEYDEVVIGASLSAILYAYIRQCPIIFKDYTPPHFYEYLEPDFPLEAVFLSNQLSSLKSPSGFVKVGFQKCRLHERILFILSLAGLVPFSNKIQTIRVEKENLIKLVTEGARLIKIKYKKLRVFNPKIIKGLENFKTQERKSLVHDIFTVKCEQHDYDFVEATGDFLKKAFFRDSTHRKDVKNIVTLSFLTKKQLNEFDYSIVPAKYKLKKILEENNFKKRNYQNKILLEHKERNVYNLSEATFTESEDIVHDKRAAKEICQKEAHTMHSPLLGVYPWKLNHLLLDSNGMIR
tara:strand:- start:484 stop:1377 length:894 start_codon:yes stop_codon:yes gene_type:complete